MSASVVIRRNQHCWGSLNEDFAPPQQNPHGNGYSNLSGRGGATASSAIYARDVSRDRAIAILGRLETPRSSQRLPAHLFQSASLPRADTGGLSFAPPSAARLRFKFFPALKASGDLLSIGFHRALTVCQDATSEFANVLHFLALSAGSTGLVSTCDGHISTEGKSTCPTKEFPKSEKIFPGLT